MREKPKPEKPGKAPSLKDQGSGLMKEIGAIITSDKEGVPYFTEDEKEEARQIIKGTRLDEKGITDLKDFKVFLSDELAKRETQKAA